MATPNSERRAGWRLPLWVRIIGYPLAALLTTLFFVFLGFPYDLLALRLEREISTAAGVSVRIGRLSPHITPLGLGLAAYDVEAGPQGAPDFEVERLAMRPAWSLRWFRGTPAIHLDLQSGVGNGNGTLTIGYTGGWEGEIRGLQLGALPLDAVMQSFSLEGTLDADIDLHGRTEEQGGGLTGQVSFELSDGTVGGAGLPLALPFDTLKGELEFLEQSAIRIEKLALTGPMLDATAEGEIGASENADQRPLDLQIAYKLRDAGLAAMMGLGSGGDGPQELSVTGTLAAPVVR